MRLVGFIVHACVGRDPVYFPSLASIIRECLFKAARIRSDIRHDKSNVDGSAIQWFLIEKLAASILEPADRGLSHGSVVAVRKIEAPLVGLGIVQTQAQTFEMTSWAFGCELQQIGAAIPHLADDGGTLHFDPGSGAG